MDSDDRPVLDYSPPPHIRRTSVKWLIPLISGAGAGVLLSSSVYGWFGCGIIVGFVVGLLSAAFASKRRLAFVLLGNGTTVVMCTAVAAIRNLRDLPTFAVVLAGVVCVPGLVGAAIVAGIDSVTRPNS